MTSADAHVGDLLLDLLQAHAVDTVFGLPGGPPEGHREALRAGTRGAYGC